MITWQKKIVSNKKALGNKIKKTLVFVQFLCWKGLQSYVVSDFKGRKSKVWNLILFLIYFIQALTTRLGNLFFCPRVDLLEHLLRFDWQEEKINYTQYWKLITTIKTLLRFCGEILRLCHSRYAIDLGVHKLVM